MTVEDLSASALMTAGQIFGIIYIVICGQFLSEMPDFIDTQNNFSTYFVVGTVVIMLIFMLLYNGEYKRLNAERQIQSLVNSIDDTTTITTMPSGIDNTQSITRKLLTNARNE